MIRNSSQHQKIKKKKGFTLIEMLVVIFIIGVGLIGALSFFNINLNNQLEAKNELIASGLAQEGTDLVRNLIDTNKLNLEDWYQNLCPGSNNCPNAPGLCGAIDYQSLSDQDCHGHTPICFNGSRYYACPNNGGDPDQTIFDRKIEIEKDASISGDLDSGGCLAVTATVTWNSRTTQAKDIICEPR